MTWREKRIEPVLFLVLIGGIGATGRLAFLSRGVASQNAPTPTATPTATAASTGTSTASATPTAASPTEEDAPGLGALLATLAVLPAALLARGRER